MTDRLREAAQAVVDWWDAPMGTGESEADVWFAFEGLVGELRAALNEPAPAIDMEARDRLRDAISGERRDWHKVEVRPDDIAALLNEPAPAIDADALARLYDDLLAFERAFQYRDLPMVADVYQVARSRAQRLRSSLRSAIAAIAAAYAEEVTR